MRVSAHCYNVGQKTLVVPLNHDSLSKKKKAFLLK